MKNFVLFFMALAIFASCQSKEEELPSNIDELKTLQRETKTSMAELDKKLAEIETKMAEIEPALFEKPRKLVTGLTLSKGDFERFIELQGAVKADETVYVSSETGGRIVNLTIKEGDYVGKGKLIATIDLDAIDKQLAEIEKSMELAKQVYERQDRLWKQNIGTEIQYLQAKNNVERLEKSMETLKYQKTKSNLYSPISGEVAQVNKERGEVAAPGEPIATLLNTRKLNITVEVPENLLPVVNRGDQVKVTIPAIDYEKTHRIKRIGTQINPANRTIPVEVEVYNNSGKIKPNLLATMFIKDFESDDVITIPANLLQQEVSGKYFVYTITDKDSEKVVAKNYIKTGESYEDRIVVLEGLSAGDILIEKGSRQVSAGEFLTVESVQSIDGAQTEMK
jgi:RND family efflux transporter MFP subunit